MKAQSRHKNAPALDLARECGIIKDGNRRGRAEDRVRPFGEKERENHEKEVEEYDCSRDAK